MCLANSVGASAILDAAPPQIRMKESQYCNAFLLIVDPVVHFVHKESVALYQASDSLVVVGDGGMPTAIVEVGQSRGSRNRDTGWPLN